MDPKAFQLPNGIEIGLGLNPLKPLLGLHETVYPFFFPKIRPFSKLQP